MAPDISKVDANRHLNSGLSAGYFCDEGTRCLFHVNSLSDPKDLLIPFFGLQLALPLSIRRSLTHLFENRERIDRMAGERART